MAALFNSWTDLHTAMLNALADFAARGKHTVVEYEIHASGNERHMKYRSLEELKKGIEWAKYMADTETGAAVRRTYAKQGGRAA